MACCVVGHMCQYPANAVRPRTPRTECHACGQPVCKGIDCSRIMLYYGNRKRICFSCVEYGIDVYPAPKPKRVKKQAWNRFREAIRIWEGCEGDALKVIESMHRAAKEVTENHSLDPALRLMGLQLTHLLRIDKDLNRPVVDHILKACYSNVSLDKKQVVC